MQKAIFTPRQCARQKAALPFSVGGMDALGCFFEDDVTTHDFSECGGSFASTHPIDVGATLKLADSTGFLSLIRIAWRQQSNGNRQNYGFAFLHPLED